MSKDLVTEVRGQQLRQDFYEIFIEMQMRKDEPFVRPYGEYKTIGDTLGDIVAMYYYLIIDNI